MPHFDHRDHNRSSYGTLYRGSGEVSYKDFFSGLSNLPVKIQFWTVPVGGSEGLHDHEGAENLEEIYLILDGEAEFISAGESRLLRAGDAALAAPSEPHGLKNVGATPLTLIVIYGKATGPHIPV